jgi:hypothetical protein
MGPIFDCKQIVKLTQNLFTSQDLCVIIYITTKQQPKTNLRR